MPDQVRHDGKEEKAGFWLGTCQNDVRGLSSRVQSCHPVMLLYGISLFSFVSKQR